MRRPRTLVLVLAGGAGGRLELLTDHRAKPAVPFAGSFRLIDFPLTNCLHSGLSDVWIVQQFHPVSLDDHLANGRPWDLDRTRGGLLLLHPDRGTDREGWHSGTADALWRQAPLIRDFAPDALVIVSADAVYRLDYAALVDEHLSTDAAVTMVTTEVAPGDAGRYGVVETDGDRVKRYVYKPDQPATNVVSNEVFAFDPKATLDVLEQLAGAGELEDLGSALLPRLVDDGRARQHRFDGYWRDVGTIDAYWSAHQDLVSGDPPLDPGDPAWPLRTRGRTDAAARVRAGAHVSDSLLSAGTDVAGTVERSVLSPGVVVEAGAVVRDAVLLHGAVVRSGAVVERTVVDELAEIAGGAQVGGAGEIALVGRQARVDGVVTPGARIEGP